MRNNKKTNKINWIIRGFLIWITVISILTPSVYGKEAVLEYKDEELLQTVENIINWKKTDTSVDAGSYLLNNNYLANAGDTTGDWYPIGLGRLGYPDDYEAYLAVISDKVIQRYLKEEKLSSSKATEWHRISLAILSMGGDPTNIGKNIDGNPINLIEDGTYDRGKSNSLGAQGINGWIWGLITLDSMRYKLPETAFNTRDDIITEIIRLQLSDGGFSLDGNESDPDITGMAIQALAPYYNSEQKYEYFQYSIDKDVNKRVRDVVDEALEYLSKSQLSSGGYSSWNTENVESAVQVLVALTSLGIDPIKDERFIKDGNTVLTSIMSFQMEDGGFRHSGTYDPDNPSANPDESNSMASEQTLYSLAALLRYKGDYRSLYDFRPEIDSSTKALIKSVRESIENLSEPFIKEEVEEIFIQYMDIPISERSYVYNYKVLSDAMETIGVKNSSEPIAANMGINTNGNGTITPVVNLDITFEDTSKLTKKDLESFKSLAKEMTTEHYVEVLKLIRKFEAQEDKKEYSDILDDLYLKKEEIGKIQGEIDSINQDILDKLYPFQSISIKDRKNVEDIMERFNGLSEYDKKKILQYEDVIRSKTQIDNRIRGGMISGVIFIIVIILLVTIRKRMRRRKIEKMKEKMLFFDDEEE